MYFTDVLLFSVNRGDYSAPRSSLSLPLAPIGELVIPSPVKSKDAQMKIANKMILTSSIIIIRLLITLCEFLYVSLRVCVCETSLL